MALKANPNWHLQPRIPAGQMGGGRWVSIGAAVPIIAQIAKVLGRIAVREAIRRIGDILRRSPKQWGTEHLPAPDKMNLEHGRIGAPSPRRPDMPYILFRSFDEFKRYAGPAGPGRQWHHIVEQRLAESGRFPPELVHSTDNIISVPIDVHRRINREMTLRDDENGYSQLRFYFETLSYPEQYNHGLELIDKAYKELGYRDGE